MKSLISIFLATFATLFALPANAASGIISVANTTPTSGYVTVSFSGPVSFVTNNSVWNPTLATYPATGGCTAKIVGSYQTPTNPQHIEGSCPQAGTLTGWATTGTVTITSSAGQSLTLTVSAAPTTTTTTKQSVIKVAAGGNPYTVTLTNVGNAQDATNAYADTYHTPLALTDLVAPAGWTCGWRMVKPRFGASYKGNGFVCSGPGIPVNGVAVIVSMT